METKALETVLSILASLVTFFLGMILMTLRKHSAYFGLLLDFKSTQTEKNANRDSQLTGINEKLETHSEHLSILDNRVTSIEVSHKINHG
jgi:hypothetical protein